MTALEAWEAMGLDHIDFLLMKADLLDAIRNATREFLESFTRPSAARRA